MKALNSKYTRNNQCSGGFLQPLIYVCASEINYVCRGLTSHLTLCKSFQGRFLQVRSPHQQCKSTEGSWDRLQSHQTTSLCYSINCRQLHLGYSQPKGPSVTKTQPAEPISCLEHRATKVQLEQLCVNIPSLLQTNITNQKRPRTLMGRNRLTTTMKMKYM